MKIKTMMIGQLELAAAVQQSLKTTEDQKTEWGGKSPPWKI